MAVFVWLCVCVWWVILLNKKKKKTFHVTFSAVAQQTISPTLHFFLLPFFLSFLFLLLPLHHFLIYSATSRALLQKSVIQSSLAYTKKLSAIIY